MNPVRRLIQEYANLAGVLSPADMGLLLFQTLRNSPSILRSGKLAAVDGAMSVDLKLRFHGHTLRIPAGGMDALLANRQDSPTFCGIREMIANDVYLRAFKQPMSCPCVVDLGCNRGMFSLLAAVVLGSRQIIEVDPGAQYEDVRDLLGAKNGVDSAIIRRYWKMIGRRSVEQNDSGYVSMETLVRENGLTRIDFAKIDIEGYESEIFGDPQWLTITQNFAVELHPEMTDTRPVLRAALDSGFHVRVTDQFNHPCNIEHGMFLYGSRDGSLKG